MSVATFAAAQLLRAIPRTRVSRAVGRLCDASLPKPLSRAVVGAYARAYRVDLGECEQRAEAWPSFDQFFTRRLLPGRRVFESGEDDLASPSDGRIEDIGRVEPGGRLLVKGRPYDVAELVGDAADAGRYHGGHFAIVYLSPRDYHRVHAPVAGRVSVVRSLPGDLWPVNSIGLGHVPSLFSRNRRVAIAIDTASRGRVTVVMVGAIIVGRITVSFVDGADVPLGEHRLDPPRELACGDELGMFHLGSTAIVFAEKGASPPWRRAPGPVRLGESLVRPT